MQTTTKKLFGFRHLGVSNKPAAEKASAATAPKIGGGKPTVLVAKIGVPKD